MTYPKCPHCKYQFDDEDIWHTGATDFPTSSDGEESEAACSNCRRELIIRLRLEPDWDFIDSHGEEL